MTPADRKGNLILWNLKMGRRIPPSIQVRKIGMRMIFARGYHAVKKNRKFHLKQKQGTISLKHLFMNLVETFGHLMNWEKMESGMMQEIIT